MLVSASNYGHINYIYTAISHTQISSFGRTIISCSVLTVLHKVKTKVTFRIWRNADWIPRINYCKIINYYGRRRTSCTKRWRWVYIGSSVLSGLWEDVENEITQYRSAIKNGIDNSTIDIAQIDFNSYYIHPSLRIYCSIKSGKPVDLWKIQGKLIDKGTSSCIVCKMVRRVAWKQM